MSLKHRKLPLGSCPQDAELKTLLERGQWPSAAPAALRTHVAECRACSEYALLATGFRAERAAASGQAQLPPAGLLWWRAQLHRRNQALERMNRPLAGAQLFALFSIIAALVAFVIFIRQDLFGFFSGLSASLPGSTPWHASPQSATHLRAGAGEWLSFSWSPGYLLAAMAFIVLAGGVALYLVNERSERG